MSKIADKLWLLREEVLVASSHGDREPPGAEIFEAILRAVALRQDAPGTTDLTLHNSIARRLAWGDNETQILADAEDVVQRLGTAIRRTPVDPDAELMILEVAAEVVTAAARVIALSAAGRAARDRAARLREELAQKNLKEVLRQQTEILSALEAEAY